jgi:membrane-associated PAP2 superfamily phosphatase
MPRLHETVIDPRVLAFTLMLSLAAGLIFSIAPALKGSKTDLHDTLKE